MVLARGRCGKCNKLWNESAAGLQEDPGNNEPNERDGIHLPDTVYYIKRCAPPFLNLFNLSLIGETLHNRAPNGSIPKLKRSGMLWPSRGKPLRICFMMSWSKGRSLCIASIARVKKQEGHQLKLSISILQKPSTSGLKPGINYRNLLKRPPWLIGKGLPYWFPSVQWKTPSSKAVSEQTSPLTHLRGTESEVKKTQVLYM